LKKKKRVTLIEEKRKDLLGRKIPPKAEQEEGSRRWRKTKKAGWTE
jgi:hypothetical protein